jgi:hypothetical protein
LKVEQLLSPTLDRLPHREVEVINFLPNDEANTTDHVRTITSAVALDVENIPPKAPVEVNAEEGLAHGDENREVEDGIWG